MNQSDKEPKPPPSPVKYRLPWTRGMNEEIKGIQYTTNTTVKELVDKLFHLPNVTEKMILPTDADKVRILFIWFTAQDIRTTNYTQTNNSETVHYQLCKLRNKQNSYASFFLHLCLSDNIPCVTIKGHVKGWRYEIGSPLTDDLIREWNAVLVEGGWHFVDSLWARVYTGTTVTTDDWYLFPEPKHLIYTHFPVDSKWQLLEKHVKEDEFIRLPIIRKRFFDMNLELLSHNSCTIFCPQGAVEITFLLNSLNTESQEFKCVTSRQTALKKWEVVSHPEENLQLEFIQVKRSLSEHEKELFFPAETLNYLNRQHSTVICNYSDIKDNNYVNVLLLQIRFPREGEYKLEVVGRQGEKQHYDWVAMYNVKVTGVPNKPVFFPRMEIPGWGPNKYLTKVGLRALSHVNGEIRCNNQTSTEIKFQILPDAKTDTIKLSSKMTSMWVAENYAWPNCKTDDVPELFVPDRNKIITIPVYLGQPGDYELSIIATLNDKDVGNVIYYRIVCEETDKMTEEKRDQEVLHELRTAIKFQDIRRLKEAINLTKTERLEKHPVVELAYNDACHLLKILQRYEEALTRIRAIESKHVAVLRSFTNPDPAIERVVKAVLVILGEPMNALKTWEDVKPFLKGIGADSLNRRIAHLDINSLSKATIKEAKKVLGDLDTVKAFQKTEDLTVLAQWLEQLLLRHRAINGQTDH